MDVLGKIVSLHIGVSALLTVLTWTVGDTFNAASCIAACAVVGLSLLALVWAWQQIFSKKLIALAVGVIVSKYAILGIIAYDLLVNRRVDFVSFLVGCSSLPLTSVAILGFASKAQPSI